MSGDRDEVGTYTLTVTDVTPEEAGPVDVVFVPDDSEPEPEGAPGHSTPGGSGTKANVSEGGTDLPTDTNTTGEVDVGGSVTGTIAPGLPTDRDWFKVELEADTRYQFDVEGVDTGRGTLANPFLWGLYDPGGSTITEVRSSDGGVGRNGRDTYTPSAAGTYYIAAAGTSAGAGTYTLSVIVLGANGNSEADVDFPDNNTTTGRVEVGASATGNVGSSGDIDWFRVDVEAGKFYQIDLEGAPTVRGTLPDPLLLVYDGFGSRFAGDDDSGTETNSRAFFAGIAAGTYYVQVQDLSGEDTGTYRLSVTELETRTMEGDTDFPADITTTGVVEVGGSAMGSIDPVGETDWFRVVLEIDRAYVFDLEGSHTGAGTLPNPHLQLFDYTGTSLLLNDNDGGEGLNSRLRYTANANGIHYLGAGSLGLTDLDKGTYTLRVAEQVEQADQGFREGATDLPTNTDTTGVVEVDGPGARGTIATEGYDFDTDWFAVELEAGRTYRIDMKGAILTGGDPSTYADPELTLYLPRINAIYDEDGGFLFNTWDRDESSSHYLFRVTFTPGGAGTYYIAATGESFGAGGYELRVIDITDDHDHPD